MIVILLAMFSVDEGGLGLVTGDDREEQDDPLLPSCCDQYEDEGGEDDICDVDEK